jgi:hypothetical protein
MPAIHRSQVPAPDKATRSIALTILNAARSAMPKAWLLGGLFGLLILPAATGLASEPVFPPSLRIGIVPPPGFVPSAEFSGFQHNDKQAQIALAELPGYAFEGLEKQISQELQNNPGTALRKEFALNQGGRAFLLTAARTSPQGPVLQWTMVANLGETTAVITALIPEAIKDVASGEALEKSFATLTVRAEVPLDEQLSVLPFSMRELAGYRIVRVQPGTAAMLTDGTKDAIETSEQPLLLISIAPAPAQPRPEERDGLARRLISDIPGVKDIRVVRSEPLRIAGQQGHELLIEAKDAKSETDVSMVQWLRFGTGTILRIIGIARKDVWESHYPRFRQVRDGIGPK